MIVALVELSAGLLAICDERVPIIRAEALAESDRFAAFRRTGGARCPAAIVATARSAAPPTRRSVANVAAAVPDRKRALFDHHVAVARQSALHVTYHLTHGTLLNLGAYRQPAGHRNIL